MTKWKQTPNVIMAVTVPPGSIRQAFPLRL